ASVSRRPRTWSRPPPRPSWRRSPRSRPTRPRRPSRAPAPRSPSS
ncbi:MAG: LSU ribosomal protein L7p/L12p (P1/P2), partial [uncultured Friedmanniella sp.]